MKPAITFPTDLEGFVAYQAQLISQDLPEHVVEALKAWVPLFNDSYKDGKAGDREALIKSVEFMDQLIAERSESKILSSFLKGARLWIVCAWKQGREEEAV